MIVNNKKGFTLIELIGVIVIIALLALIITPIVTNVISNSKDKLYKNTLKNIELSAKDWFSDEENIEKLPNNFETCYISLSELKDNGVVDLDIKNPKTGDLLNDNLIKVIVTKNNKSYNYNVVDDGSYSGSPCLEIINNPLQPVLSANSFQGFKKSFDLVISYDNLNNPTVNIFEYYISSQPDRLEGGEWKTYSNGAAQSIGNSLNGDYYVFVKRLFNIVDNEYQYSTYGGINVTIDSKVYQRFGPYRFDNEKPKIDFYKKTNSNNFNETALQRLNYAYAEDDVTISFRVTDENFESSNISLNSIKILIGETDVTSSISKSLSNARNLSNGVEYTLSLSNLSGKGELSIVIDENIVTDKAGNKNDRTTIDTKIKVNMCPYDNNKTYTFNAGTTNIWYIPCDGTYKFELSGAAGGGSNGGAGAKTTGEISLTRKTKIAINVGGRGGSNIAGFNGGGKGIYGGGGATDIRIGGTSLANRIMVAGGGGGGATLAGGSAGGISGSSADIGSSEMCSECVYSAEGVAGEYSSCAKYDSYCSQFDNYCENDPKECVARTASGGSQINAGLYASTIHYAAFSGAWTGFSGKLGQGGNGVAGGGGGGGYYGGGGGTATPRVLYGGGGGSSYISGATGFTTHSSGYMFTNTSIGTNSDTGSAKITLLNS